MIASFRLGFMPTIHSPFSFTDTHLYVKEPYCSFKAIPPQKSIFVQESPNEQKFIEYVGGIM